MMETSPEFSRNPPFFYFGDYSFRKRKKIVTYEAEIVTYGPKSSRMEMSPAQPPFSVLWCASKLL